MNTKIYPFTPMKLIATSSNNEPPTLLRTVRKLVVSWFHRGAHKVESGNGNKP
jgi:hypothetical protein